MRNNRRARWLVFLLAIGAIGLCTTLALKYKVPLKDWAGRVSQRIVRVAGYDKPPPSGIANPPPGNPVNRSKAESRSSSPAGFVPVMALFDQTSLYTKGDRVEIYGADLRQSRSGPILVTDSSIRVNDRRAAIAWWPTHSTADDATHLRIRFSSANHAAHGTASLIFQFADGYSHKFAIQLGSPAATVKGDPNRTPLAADLAAIIDSTRQATDIGYAREVLVELPSEFGLRLGNATIKLVILCLDDASGNDVRFSEIALVRMRTSMQAAVTIRGSLVAAPQPPGSIVRLHTPSGPVRNSIVSASNSFVFTDVPADVPVSIRFGFENQDYFPDQGRWIVPGDDMSVRIHVEPLYVNPDNHPSDVKSASFVAITQDNPGAAFYQPHSRQHWPGIGAIQVYDSYTFTNNWGFVDRDRFVENPEGCFRIVHLGSSHSVALQIPVSQKYNMLLEEELGLILRRCVEVISAGRDNGDIGSNYPRVRDYAVRFSPDLILIENSTSLIMQLHPYFSVHGLGWNPEHSALDNFFYNADGKLQFRPNSPNYNLHTTKPDYPEIVPGVRYFDTLKIQWSALPKVAREDFQYMVDIAKFFEEKHPNMRFVLHNGLDQAQCAASCSDQQVKSEKDEPISVGVEQFLQNLRKVCSESALECIDLPIPPDSSNPRRAVTFYLDGHYNVRGHQWLARELAKGVVGLNPKAYGN